MTYYCLVETSAWVEWLRDTGSPTCDAVAERRLRPDLLATTEPVALELRSGAPTAGQALVDRVLTGAVQLGLEPAVDFAVACDLYRAARSTGATVRSLMDCLIAAVALRTGAELLHCDRDFDVLAAMTPDLRATNGGR